MNSLGSPIPWLSLYARDDDPGRRSAYLIAALQKVGENAGREIESLLHSGQLPPIETLGRLHLLVIDELGYIPMDARRANLFFQLVNRVYTRASVIITTNVPFDEWGSVFGGDEVIAAAVLDRLLHQSHVFLITGPSYLMQGKLAQALDETAELRHDTA